MANDDDKDKPLPPPAVPPQQQAWVPDQMWDPPPRPRNNALFESQPAFVPPPQGQGVSVELQGVAAVGRAAGEGLAHAAGASTVMATGGGELTLTPAPAAIGRVAIANRDAILVQALSIELLLRDAIDQRANSGGLPELQTILARVVDMRTMLDTAVAAPVEASVGAQALSFKDGLLEWWNKNHVSILDRSFNSGLLVGGLMLVAYCGLVPVATVAAAIHGKEFTEAVKALAEVMKRIGGSRD